MGISKTLVIDVKTDIDSLTKQVVQLIGENPSVTLECSGAELSINLAINVTKDGGDIVMIGISNKKVNVQLGSAACRQVNLLGIKRYLNRSVTLERILSLTDLFASFPLAIQLVASGRVDVKPLITHTFPLSEALTAFQTAKECATNGAIKVQVECQQ